MKLLSLGVVSWVISLPTCSHLDLQNVERQGVQCCAAESLDFEIYSAILDSQVPFSRVLVREETSSPQIQSDWLTNGVGDDSVTENPALMRELIADYRQRSAAKIRLAGLGSLENVHAISEQQLDRIFTGGSSEGYERLKQEFPDAAALVAFSLPGYARGR